MGFEDMEVVRKGYSQVCDVILPVRWSDVTAVQVAMEQCEQTMKEHFMKSNYYTAVSGDTGMNAFEDSFRQICKVKFIKCLPFDGDIEQRLSVLLDSGMAPSLTDKEYYYRHDIVGLNCGDIVIVPARDTITIAVVSTLDCQHTDNFSCAVNAVRRSMKKVIARVIISRTLAEQLRGTHRRTQLRQEREELLQKVRTTEAQINSNTQQRSRIATECKNAESMAKTLQDNLALYQGRLVAINRSLGE